MKKIIYNSFFYFKNFSCIYLYQFNNGIQNDLKKYIYLFIIMVKYITLGKCGKHYKYIIFASIFAAFSIILFGKEYEINNKDYKVLLLINTNTQKMLSKHIVIHNIVRYFGVLILSIILYKFDEEKNVSKLIKMYGEQENIKNFNERFIIILIITIWIIQEFLSIVFYRSCLRELDFWMIELFMLCYFNSTIIKFRPYLHHKLINWLNLIICSILKILIIVLNLSYDNNILYNKYKWLIPIGVIYFLIIVLMRTYTLSKLKLIIDTKYISPSKILRIYGIIGICINLIIIIISTFFKCYKTDNFNLYLCNISNNDNMEKYFENVMIYWKTLIGKNKNENYVEYEILLEIYVRLLDMIIDFFKLYFYILIIKFLSPIHYFFCNLVYTFYLQIIIIIYSNIINDDTPGEFRIESLFISIFSVLSVCFTCFGLFVYLELIELNFCGLNYNLRKNIILRGEEDNLGPLIVEENERQNSVDETKTFSSELELNKKLK